MSKNHYFEGDSEGEIEDSGEEYTPSEDEINEIDHGCSQHFPKNNQAKKPRTDEALDSEKSQSPSAIQSESSKTINISSLSNGPTNFSVIFVAQNDSSNETVPTTSKTNTVKDPSAPKKVSLPKEVVIRGIRDSEFSIGEVVRRNSKNNSLAWDHIRCIFDGNKNVIDGKYFCLNCSEVLVNDTKSTTPFLRHIKACNLKKKQIPITRYAKTSVDATAQNTVKVSMQHRQNLKDGMSQFVCNDLRPYLAVEGKGFVASMCAAFEVGQANPSLSRSDFIRILPGRTTVQKDIESKVDVAKKKVKGVLQQAYKAFGGFACTSDMWTDDFRQKSYITVTAHVPILNEEDITYARYVIGVEEVTENEKTKEVIEKYILAILSWYGFSEKEAESIYLVTDRGSNYKSINKFKRANCYAHMLHNIVKAMCKDTELSEVIQKLYKKSLP